MADKVHGEYTYDQHICHASLHKKNIYDTVPHCAKRVCMEINTFSFLSGLNVQCIMYNIKKIKL